MSDSDYRQHMAEYFRMRAEGAASPEYSPEDNHPQDGYEPATATPSEIEWGAEGQYEPTTNYSLEGYKPIDSVVVEAPLGHGVAFDLGAEGRPYPDASVPDIFEDLPRQNAEISGVNFEAEDPIIEGTKMDSDKIYIEPLEVQEGKSLDGYTAMDSVVEQAPLGYGVPQWYGRAEGSAGDQVVSWEDDAGVSSPSAPPSNIMWAEGDQGYDDRQDESIGERHRGGHEQSLKARRDEAAAMDKHSRMGRKYDDVSTMDAEGWGKTCQVEDRDTDEPCTAPATINLQDILIEYEVGSDPYEKMHLGDINEFFCKKHYDEMDDMWAETKGSEHHKGQGYNDEMDESLGMRHRGRHSQSFKDRRDEASAMDKRHSRMGRKYDDVSTMDADSFPANRISEIKVWMCHRCGGLYHVKEMAEDCHHHASEHHKGQGYDDELDESLGMSHKESGMKQSLKDRRDESKGTEKFDNSRAYSRVQAMDAEMDGGKDWNMGLTQYAGSAGGTGMGTPVSYGGIALPESAVADLVESSTDNPMDATIGTVMGTMGAETALPRKKSKRPAARQRGRAATQGIDNDPCNKSDRACPQDKALWQKSKQRASKEYRVWPSPHASAYAVQLYNTAGGKWKGASATAHPKANKKNLGKNSLGNYYDGNYKRGDDSGKAVDFSDRKTHVTHGDCGRAYTKDMSPAEFRKSFPRCLPQSGAAGMTAKGQKKETLNKRARLNKRKFRGGKGVTVPVDRKAGRPKKK